MNSKTIAFSGSHGTGKTTAALNEMLHQKFAHPTLSVCPLIDLEARCPYPINAGMTEASQVWLFSNQIRSELTVLATFDLVVTDRTVVDILAYTYAAGFTDLAQSMLAYAAYHMHSYQTITVKKIINNDHLHADGIRDAEDLLFRQDVEDALVMFYDQLVADRHIKGNICYV